MSFSALPDQPTDDDVIAFWDALMRACEDAIIHSYVDYGDGHDALARGNQYDSYHQLDLFRQHLIDRLTRGQP